MDAWVEVIRPDGTSERHRLEGERTTLGRSPVAGIPLVNSPELMPEHMLFAPRPEGCWVSIAQNAQPPAFVRGEPFGSGMLPWGTEIQVGSVRLRVLDRLPATKAGGSFSSPVTILALVLLPLIAWLFLSDGGEALPAVPDVPAPELFATVDACPDRGPAALHRARESAEAASHKAERYAFEAQDGVDAVRLYRVAEVCYRAADRAADARRMQRDGRALERQIDEDYRTHQLRLERALEQERFDEALLESRALVALLRHTEGPYTAWVRLLRRQLQLMMDQAYMAQQ